MAGEFQSLSGNLENILVSDYNMIDQYIGGSLWTSGYNFYGQLGNNNTTDQTSPVQTISGGTDWKQVAVGPSNMGGIKTDGTLWMWGYGGPPAFGGGTLGDNTTVSKSSPVQTVAGGTNWKQVQIGLLSTAAIKTDGSLWVWGSGTTFGDLGDGGSGFVSSPVQITTGGNNWRQVFKKYTHSAAISANNSLYLWGKNTYGQQGNGNRTINYGLTILGANKWITASVGQEHTAAIQTDGTLWTWGYNLYGQLGTNDTSSRSSPVQTVSGGTNWKQVSCGFYYTAAIKTDGTLWIWGRNNAGQLGDNIGTSYSSPVQTISGGTNWKQIACGSQNTGAIKTDGTLWTWGSFVYSPTAFAYGGNNWKEIQANGDVGGSTIGAIYFYDVNNLYPSA